MRTGKIPCNYRYLVLLEKPSRLCYIRIMANTGKNYRGCQFELDGETFTIQDQSWDAVGLLVWFENDGTKWVYFSEIEDLLLSQPE